MKSLIFFLIFNLFAFTMACKNQKPANKDAQQLINALGTENSVSGEAANALLAEEIDTTANTEEPMEETTATTSSPKEEKSVAEKTEKPSEKTAAKAKKTTDKTSAEKTTKAKKVTEKTTQPKKETTPASSKKAPKSPPPSVSLSPNSKPAPKKESTKPTKTTDKNAIIAPTPPHLQKEEAKEAPPKPQNTLNDFFNKTQQFMQSNVRNGLVAYNRIAGNPSALNDLVKRIAEADLSGANSTQKQAFYINAYNILVIKSLIDNNIPKQPLSVNGFFNAKPHKVAGKTATLDKLEKQWLFGLKKDPRFHFVVVCGAIGCPRLENFAYKPSLLNSQLNKQTKRSINDPSFIQVKEGEKKVLISEIFKWYKSDFTSTGKSVLEYINGYRNSKIPADYTIDYYPYNWDVNKQ